MIIARIFDTLKINTVTEHLTEYICSKIDKESELVRQTIATSNKGFLIMNELVQAASLLETDEYQLIEQAYINWHGKRANDKDLYQFFSQYMQYGTTPYWVENYAKTVIQDWNSHVRHITGFYCLASFAPRVAKVRNKPSYSVDWLKGNAQRVNSALVGVPQPGRE